MRVINPPTPFAYTVFCDEVRTENNGKEIYLGVYNGVMLLRQIPIQVPSLTVLVHYCEGVDIDEKNDVEINVWVPEVEEPVFRQTIPRSEIIRQRPPPREDRGKEPDAFHFNQMKIAVEIRPFTVLAEGRVKVRIRTGDLEVRAPGLQIANLERFQQSAQDANSDNFG